MCAGRCCGPGGPVRVRQVPSGMAALQPHALAHTGMTGAYAVSQTMDPDTVSRIIDHTDSTP